MQINDHFLFKICVITHNAVCVRGDFATCWIPHILFLNSMHTFPFRLHNPHRRSQGGALGSNSPSQESAIDRAPKTESNREMGTKRHFVGAFSALLARRRCIRGQGSDQIPLWELTALPQTPSWSPRTPPHSWLSASNFGPQVCPLQDKFLATPMRLHILVAVPS